MRSGGPGAGVAGRDGCIYRPCPCRLPPLRHSSYLYASELAHVCVHAWLCALRRKGCGRDCIIAIAGAEGCHGGGFPLQYVRACFMMHSFLTLGFIRCDDVYITIVFYFYQKDFMVMYRWIFTYECVFYYVLGQRLPNKQAKSIYFVYGCNILKT